MQRIDLRVFIYAFQVDLAHIKFELIVATRIPEIKFGGKTFVNIIIDFLEFFQF